jgi:zinc transporter ZupT
MPRPQAPNSLPPRRLTPKTDCSIAEPERDRVVETFFWGAIGAAALLIGALIAYFLNPSRQVIAIVMAIGIAVIGVSAISAAAGYAVLGPAGARTGALIEAFAAGALLAMLADTLLPEAYKVEKVFTGPLVVIGFAISLELSAA